MNPFFVNALIYIIFTIFIYKKSKDISLYLLIWIEYSIIALLGYISVIDGTYFSVVGHREMAKVSYLPLFLAFCCYFIFFHPLKNLNGSLINVNNIKATKPIQIFVDIWVILFIGYSILKLTEAVASISLGLAETYDMRHNQGVSLFNYSPILSKINGYGYYLLSATTPFIMVYAIYFNYKKAISNAKSLFLIFLCFFPSICSSIGQGSRGSLFMNVFCFMFFLLLLKKYFRPKLKKYIYISLGVIAGAALFYALAITFQRVGEGSKGYSSIERYFGEPFPNLCWSFWDKVTYHPMGDRLFPNLTEYNMTFTSIDEEYTYWGLKTDVPILNFKTLFGDLYIEFGIIGAIIFILTFSLLVKKLLLKREVSIFSLNYLYFYFQICVFAFAGFTKTGHDAIFTIIIMIIVNILVSYLMYGKPKVI